MGYRCGYCGKKEYEWVTCQCGRSWCSEDCAKAEGFDVIGPPDPHGNGIYWTTQCDYCKIGHLRRN